MSEIKHPDFMYLRKLEDYEVVEHNDIHVKFTDNGFLDCETEMNPHFVGLTVEDYFDKEGQSVGVKKALYRICEPPEDEPVTDANNLSFSIGLVIGVLSVALLWLCVSFVN